MPGKYQNRIADFLRTENETVIGHLAIGVTNHQLLIQQRISWDHQITFLKETFNHLPTDWHVILEYPIPRRSKRIDIILLTNDLIFVIEFKDNETRYSTDAINQVEDYSLDLRDFHKQSTLKTLIPVVWASVASDKSNHPVESSDILILSHPTFSIKALDLLSF